MIRSITSYNLHTLCSHGDITIISMAAVCIEVILLLNPPLILWDHEIC